MYVRGITHNALLQFIFQVQRLIATLIKITRSFHLVMLKLVRRRLMIPHNWCNPAPYFTCVSLLKMIGAENLVEAVYLITIFT